MKKKLILIGAGGHAKSCIDVIELTEEFEIAGLLDMPARKGTKLLGYEVIGTDADVPSFVQQGYWFLVTVGQIKNAAIRVSAFNDLRAAGAQIATVISPLAHVSKHAVVEAGTIVMHGAKVNAGAHVGENCIINTNANIEHDTVIGDHIHISTQAVLNGDCKIGDRVFIGSGAIVQQGVEIISGTIIGAGTLVHKNILNQGTYVGIPFVRIG